MERRARYPQEMRERIMKRAVKAVMLAWVLAAMSTAPASASTIIEGAGGAGGTVVPPAKVRSMAGWEITNLGPGFE